VTVVNSETGDNVESIPFPDDPYLTEDVVFIEAITSGDSSNILSSYSDAVESYKLSHKIQHGATA
jgi:hypothetical protein